MHSCHKLPQTKVLNEWLAGNQPESNPPRPQPSPVRHSESVATPSASATKAGVPPASPADSDAVVTGMVVPSEKSPSYSPSMASEKLACEKGNDVCVPRGDGDNLVPGNGPAMPHDMESLPDFDLDQVPDINNTEAPRLQKGEHHLTPNAIRCRARRIMTPRVDGSLKVSETIFREWHQKGQPRKNLEEIFKQCGYDPES